MSKTISHNNTHFTGKRSTKRVTRKGLTRKQRRLKRRTHKDKYNDSSSTARAHHI